MSDLEHIAIMDQTKPILFNTEMVRAILDGRKTVTRRIADINTEIPCGCSTDDHEFVPDNFNHTEEKPTGFVCRRCGFGVAPPYSRVPCGESLFRPRYWPGDILYVRETFTEDGGRYYYRADFESDWLEPCETLSGGYPAACRYRNCDTCCEEGKRILWKPSIHMPKEAARIFLRVTNVRVERLRNMVLADVLMEGITEGESYDDTWKRWHDTWNSTIKPADLSTKGWEANPWVWVIKFEQISKEESI